MSKIKSYFLILIIGFLISCDNNNNNKRNAINKRVYNLHQKIKKTSNDSIIYFLKITNSLINKNSPDTLKAENNYKNGYYNYYVTKNIDTSFYFYNKAISFSKDSLKRDREFYYFYNLANNYLEKLEYSDAIHTVNQCEKFLNNSDLTKLKYLFNIKQRLYNEVKKYDSVYKYNNQILKISNLQNDSTNTALSIIEKSRLNFHNLNNKKLAYKLIDSLIKSNLISKDNFYVHYYLHNQYKEFLFSENKINKSFSALKKSIYYIKKSKYKDDLPDLVSNYVDAVTYTILLKKYALTTKYIDSVDLYKKYLYTKDKKEILNQKLKLSYLTNKDFNIIEREFDTIYSFLINTTNNRINSKFNALKKANKIEKKLLIENQKSIIQNERLKSNQYILYSLLVFLFLSFLIGVLYYRQKKIQNTKNEILMLQRLFRAQMNPHFTSNILYSIQNLNKIDFNKANTYLTKFSRLLRLSLINSTHDYVNIEDEIELLAKYLDLQQLRFPSKFEYKINYLNIEKDSGLKIPPMLIQPFVENAIEHGFKNINYIGQINITLKQTNKSINCIIDDNGVGISSTKKSKTSTSTVLISSLLKRIGNKGITIKNKNYPNKGTNIDFDIPYKIQFD